jgi:hypothetical protein
MVELQGLPNGQTQPASIALQDFAPPPNQPSAASEHGTEGYRDDTASFDSNWTESTTVPRRNLGFVQCSALMINQMVGSGIFTLPGVVLLLTKSKPIAVVLWAVGGIYSMLRFVYANVASLRQLC